LDFYFTESNCKGILKESEHILIIVKAKPVARQGRKATGLIEIAGLPFTSEPSCLLRGFSVFLFKIRNDYISVEV